MNKKESFACMYLNRAHMGSFGICHVLVICPGLDKRKDFTRRKSCLRLEQNRPASRESQANQLPSRFDKMPMKFIC